MAEQPTKHELALYRLAERKLIAAGINTRDDLISRFDKRHGTQGLKGVGPRLSKQIEYAVKSFDADTWAEAFPNIEYGHEEDTGA